MHLCLLNIPTVQELVVKWEIQLFNILNELYPEDFRNKGVNIDVWKNNKKKYDNLPHLNYYTWKKHNNDNREESDYSFLFSKIHPTPKDRQIFIENIISGTKPTFGYMFLSGLINAGKFKNILTTNFDDLLGDALYRWYPVKPVTCSFDSMISGIRESPRPKIIKLHGDYLYDNMKNVREELKSLDSNMEHKMFEMCTEGLVVVGYSGQDKSIMNLLREMLRKEEYLTMGLHWCLMKHEVNTINKVIKGTEEDNDIINKYRELIELRDQYSNNFFFYQINNFDSLMETLFLECGCELPKIFENPEKVDPFHEFRESVRLSKRDVDLTSYENELLDKLGVARLQKYHKEDIIHESSKHFREGIKSRDKAKVDKENEKEYLSEAKNSFEKCIDIIKEFGDNPRNEEIDFATYIYVLKRLSGVYISIAKINIRMSENVDKINEYFDLSLTNVDKGINIINNISNQEKEKYKMDLISFPYNGCCAISKKYMHTKPFTESDKSKIFDFFEIDISLDPTKNHAKQILEDPDFKFLFDEIGEEIKEKFKI